jgi:prepilin-type N-terminal cleavage/methylation domain-containing protein
MEPKNNSGVTLIEILVAIALIGLVFVGYLMFYGTSTSASYETKQRYAALNLARQQVERCKALEGKGISRSTVSLPAAYDQPVNGISYRITTTFIPNSELPAEVSGDSNYCPIRVTVSWTVKNDPKTITLDSYIINTSQ